MDGKQTVISAKNLSKTFSNESVQQHVLKNLNLSIYKGDFTVIMGNSGSGKSTLLYALSGMDRPSIGTVSYYVKRYIIGDRNITVQQRQTRQIQKRSCRICIPAELLK